MIKYFKNGVLQAETLDLPQDCGDIKVTLSVEQELEEACYYLEFSCPRNVKYISQRLEKVADNEFELLLPRGISEYMGEVYVQLVIMSATEARLISRSLIARDPLFVIKESILASHALESTDRRDFFEYAADVVRSAQSKIDEVDGLVENMPNVIELKVEHVLDNVFSSIEDCNNNLESRCNAIDEKIDQNKADIASKVDKSKLLQTVGSSTTEVMSQKAVCDELAKKVDLNSAMVATNSIELGGTIETPYIDWHYKNSSNDYDMRMILNSANRLDITGGTVNFEKIMQSGRELFPVGSILMYTDDTQPASIFGGTWEKVKDRFLVGAGGAYSLGSIGGEEIHKLTVNEIPSHQHQVLHSHNHQSSNTAVFASGGEIFEPAQEFQLTRDAGGNQPHNNMPPYLAVNIWKRIA